MANSKRRKKVKPPEEQELRLEYVRLGELKKWPANPKDHDIVQLNTSLARHGYTEPILVNDYTEEILHGHGRVQTLEEAQRAKQPPPSRVKVAEDGEWLVPVICGIEMDPEDHAHYGVTANQSTIAGGWDEVLLQKVLHGLHEGEGLEGTGFDVRDLKRIEEWGEDGGEQHTTPIPDMELQPFEHWDYVVFMFKDVRDFMRAMELLDLPRVNVSVAEGHPKLGLGRIVDGRKLFEVASGNSDDHTE